MSDTRNKGREMAEVNAQIVSGMIGDTRRVADQITDFYWNTLPKNLAESFKGAGNQTAAMQAQGRIADAHAAIRQAQSALNEAETFLRRASK